MTLPARIDDLPGSRVVERGLVDLHAGVRSTESLLVSAGAERLRALGVWFPGPVEIDSEPELALYRHLAEIGVPDPYSTYNALRRELASFVRALEHRIERARRAGQSSG